ncbi:YciI family protein [Radicibacter daui]|uniref:YciI family protein n=1 Tax=Radicibacter daui TaxID=3064829 RepID=UPI004046B67E
MLFTIYCLDKANALDLRMVTRPTHIDYLDRHNDRLVYGGPLLGDDGKALGSLLIVEATDLADATAFAEADPYAQAGLFQSVTIKATSKVYPKPAA